jgi:hypothetical protein
VYPETGSYDSTIEVLKQENAGIVLDIATKRLEIVARQKAIADNLDRAVFFDGFKEKYQYAFDAREKIQNKGVQFGANAKELEADVVNAKSGTRGSLREAENKIRDGREQEVQLVNAAKNDVMVKQRDAAQRHQKKELEFRDQKNLEDSELVEARSQLKDLTMRFAERADLTLEVDGEVVFSDALHNTVVINLGTAHGVQNGFRFEVFRLHPDNRKERKAFIEVRKANVGSSDCMLLRRDVEYPTDPMSGYVAEQPEELISPRVNKDGAAQPLSGAPKVVHEGDSVVNPVVAGDLIHNPFYKRNKTFTYYIAGDKTIQHGMQKSAIRYTWRDIADKIRFYGGRVVETVDADVDFIIAQKKSVPTDAKQRGEGDVYDQQAMRGIALGIPVLYEWELFRFLEER